WAAARKRRLLIQVCADTGKFQHYPRPVSLATGSRNLAWKQVSGMGEIYTWTVIRVPVAGFDPADGLVVATIQLDEGVRIHARLLDTDIKDIAIGTRVALDWDILDDGTP